MSKTFFKLLATTCIAIAATTASAGQLKSGGQYEAELRNVGIPLSGGMTYQTHSTVETKHLNTVYGSVRSSGQYEATLRHVGMPISNGLAWSQKN